MLIQLFSLKNKEALINTAMHLSIFIKKIHNTHLLNTNRHEAGGTRLLALAERVRCGPAIEDRRLLYQPGNTPPTCQCHCEATWYKHHDSASSKLVCLNYINRALWSERLRIKSTLLGSWQTSPASATFLPHGNADRARLRCTDTDTLLNVKMFKFDMACKQKKYPASAPSISWNVLARLKTFYDAPMWPS